VRVLDRFDASSYRTRIAAQVDDFVPAHHLSRRQVQRLDRFSQFAVVASRLALDDAGLEKEALPAERSGIFLGTGLAGFAYAEAQSREFFEGGVRAISPVLAMSVFGGSAACSVAIELGVQGIIDTNAMSCAAGAIALGRALQAIREGEADVVLAGGTEAPLAPLCFGAFTALQAMSTRNDDPARACRPFDRQRDGFVMGEGAAVLVVESEEHARARGARIYAELAGFGTTSDAHHPTAPLPDGKQAARCFRRAIDDAQLPLDAIGYVNAHASSTPLNDVAEAKALRAVFGDLPVAVSGTKALYGHSLGAVGAIEAALTCLALREGFLPGTVNLEAPEPGLGLDLVPPEGRAVRVQAALSSSLGFGGVNACLAFRAHRA
jgi:3-oxoacyl-[acyl-carrier-protein] synthase II